MTNVPTAIGTRVPAFRPTWQARNVLIDVLLSLRGANFCAATHEADFGPWHARSVSFRECQLAEITVVRRGYVGTAYKAGLASGHQRFRWDYYGPEAGKHGSTLCSSISW